jgi:hypothetical protein
MKTNLFNKVGNITVHFREQLQLTDLLMKAIHPQSCRMLHKIIYAEDI